MKGAVLALAAVLMVPAIAEAGGRSRSSDLLTAEGYERLRAVGQLTVVPLPEGTPAQLPAHSAGTAPARTAFCARPTGTPRPWRSTDMARPRGRPV